MTTNAQVNQVMALIQLGELALQMARADQLMKQARLAYYDEIKKFESKFADGRRLKVDANDPLYERRCLYTREEFEEFQVAKKRAYRAKRKLLAACTAIAATQQGGAR